MGSSCQKKIYAYPTYMYMYFAYFGDSVELYKGIPFDCMHMHRERNTPFPIPTPTENQNKTKLQTYETQQ